MNGIELGGDAMAMTATNCLAAALVACSVMGCIDSTGTDTNAPAAPPAPGDVSTSTAALHLGQGRQLFEHAFAGTNGRSCATCHELASHGVLPPEHVTARLAADPSDPLFSRLDADDPAAAVPTFEHLERGLIRVTLPLPANMDVIDADGNVVTSPDRMISVWRGVPTIENTVITAPYQLDGRLATLEEQAQAAISTHSAGPIVSDRALAQISAFERGTLSSSRAGFVAALAEIGVPIDRIPSPEAWMPLSASERRGRAVYDTACAACHGGATTNRIVNRAVHDSLFFELAPDGNIVFDIVAGQPSPRLASRPHDEVINIGFTLLSGYGQLGILPMANADVELSRYRFRFYADGSRTHQVTDLPPIPRDAAGNRIDPPNLNPALDDRGAPIVGPSLAPEWFSSDPGRAAITGDPADFEAFDIPQLRGIAHTAPYFHDNSHATLADVVDSYSRFILSFIPPLHLPLAYQDSPDSPFGEALSLDQKHDLVAFLERL